MANRRDYFYQATSRKPPIVSLILRVRQTVRSAIKRFAGDGFLELEHNVRALQAAKGWDASAR
jgi:hypothetical protein